ncbi:hypothetical protein MJT46_011208 [Ovis ammon polii x Ovis aries]|nr:hypothetical protein MJT46_011208 [Ovis ammon polii x Ovis aries]
MRGQAARMQSGPTFRFGSGRMQKDEKCSLSGPSSAPPHWKAEAGQGAGSAHAQRCHVEPARRQTLEVEADKKITPVVCAE